MLSFQPIRLDKIIHVDSAKHNNLDAIRAFLPFCPFAPAKKTGRKYGRMFER